MAVLGYDDGWTSVAGGAWNEGEWHHVAMVYDADTDTLELFDNGVSQGTTVQADPQFNTMDLRLGASDHYGNHFTGMLDKVRIWHDARTETEILDNMHRELNGDEEDLAAYFPLNQTGATGLDDVSANGNDGTADGATWVASTIPCAANIADEAELRGAWIGRNDPTHASSVLTLSDPDIAGTDFVVFGHDNGDLDMNGAARPANYASCLGPVWRLEVTDSLVGNLAFDCSGVTGIAETSRLRLLVDDDGDLSSGASVVEGSYDADTFTVAGHTYQDGAYYSLGELGAAPTVTTAAVTNISSTMADSGGSVTDDGGLNISARGVCWNTAGTPEASDDHAMDGGGAGDFDSSMTGLAPDTVYYVRAYAINPVGADYGEERTFAILPAPEIDIAGNGVGIADGSTAISAEDGTDFGGATVGGITVAHTFTIENTGAGPLDFTDSPAVTLAGAGAVHFAVSAQPALDPVPVDGSTTFQVTFDPSAGGVHTATVGIAGNDADETPYTFDIQGTERTPGFTVVESDGGTEVSETGTQDTFTVALDAQPESDVVITVVSGDTGEAAASPDTLTFAPEDWNIAQTVTVTGVDDTIIDGAQTTLVTLSVDDARSDDLFDPLADRTVTVTTQDDVADHLKGDVNGDGTVTLDDAVLALEIVCGVDTGDTFVNMEAEVDEDGAIGMAEVAYVLQVASQA